MRAFRTPGMWLKGCLHLHSTVSDGAFEREDLVDRYRRAGYDFLAFTDHEILSSAAVDDSGFIRLSGIEHSVQCPGIPLVHIVGIGLERTTDDRSIDGVCAFMRDHAAFFFLAHPYWSALDHGTFPGLERFPALEVFNTGCELEIARGHSEYFWDNALSAGRRIGAVAVDDSHQRLTDYTVSWVCVRARERSVDAILEALAEGRFYCSNGPTIEDIAVVGARVDVHCSPCRQVRFICNTYHGGVVSASAEGPLCEAQHQLSDRAFYLRVECMDEQGRTAWSNPVYRDGDHW